MMNIPETSRQEGKAAYLRKIFLVFLIITVPVFLTVLICRPMIARRSARAYRQFPQLKESFSEDDVRRLVLGMKDEAEFAYYFRVFPPNEMTALVHDVCSELAENHGQAAVNQLLKEKIASLENMALVVNHLDYPPELSPERDAPLIRVLWQFYKSEFKLIVTGLVYKSVYDPQYQFQWSAEAHAAAQKLKLIFARMSS